MNRRSNYPIQVASIPAGWEISTLSDALEIRSESTQPSSNGNSKYVGLEHIDSGDPKLSRWGTEAEVRSSKNKFYAGDVLYGKLRPYLDKVVLAEWEGMCATDILVFRVKEEKAVPQYLVNLLHTSELLNHAISTTTGVNHPRTSWHALKNFEFGLPPLPEQRTIAAILSKIQQAIEVQGKIIERTKELKKSLMAKLFTEGLHGEELKETEIGLMPKSWEVVKLVEVCEKPQYGYTESATTKDTGTRFLRISDIQDGVVNWSEVPYCPISQGDLEKFRLRSGDILFARIGATTGKSYLVKGCPQAVFASYLIRVRTMSSVGSEYLYYFFNSVQYWKQVNSQKDANLKKGMSGTMLAELTIPHPSNKEQEEITGAFRVLDTRIAAARKKQQSLQNLFKSMLHQLMTGQIRVNNIEATAP